MPETAVWPQHSGGQLPASSQHSLQQFPWVYIAMLQVFSGLCICLNGLQLHTVKCSSMVEYGQPDLPYEWPDMCVHMRATKSAEESTVDMATSVLYSCCHHMRDHPPATSSHFPPRLDSVCICPLVLSFKQWVHMPWRSWLFPTSFRWCFSLRLTWDQGEGSN